MRVKLLTMPLELRLKQNYEINKNRPEKPVDHLPVVKFFGGSACTWLITEYDEKEGLFFGLCDLGQGFPELGYVSREELESIRFPPFGLGVERDRFFKPDKTISQYAEAAQRLERIEA